MALSCIQKLALRVWPHWLPKTEARWHTFYLCFLATCFWNRKHGGLQYPQEAELLYVAVAAEDAQVRWWRLSQGNVKLSFLSARCVFQNLSSWPGLVICIRISIGTQYWWCWRRCNLESSEISGTRGGRFSFPIRAVPRKELSLWDFSGRFLRTKFSCLNGIFPHVCFILGSGAWVRCSTMSQLRQVCLMATFHQGWGLLPPGKASCWIERMLPSYLWKEWEWSTRPCRPGFANRMAGRKLSLDSDTVGFIINVLTLKSQTIFEITIHFIQWSGPAALA